jgi:O-methyltransferase involved in polyketide biosynthesis
MTEAVTGKTYTISDTANWVAFHRAVESARPDAVFRDPLAARLPDPRRLGKARWGGVVWLER